MKFSGKTILITGASTGIGKALAEEFSKIDCNLVLIARRIHLLEEIRNNLKDNAARIEIFKCDVSSKKEVGETYQKIVDEFNSIDIAVLNSGVGQSVTPENYNSEYAEEIFGANVFGLIYWIEAILPSFLKKKEGVFVGVSSLADNRGYSGSGFYCASKAAATTYLEGLRVDLAAYNIQVLTVRPGFVKTPMTDKNNFHMPFMMSSEEAAKIILQGIMKEKRYIQFPAIMFLLTRLIGFLPNPVYEYLSSLQLKKRK